MFIDLSALRKYRDYRLLFLGQLVSFFGSMITYVAIPYQIYKLTESTFLVGLLGIVQLIPVLVFGLVGGSAADSMDRRKLLLWSEAVLAVCAAALAVNATLGSPNVTLVFVLAGAMQAANGFHRPAMDAMTQKLVSVEDLPSVAALGSFRYSASSVVGPAVGGILIAKFGPSVAYWIDCGTFAVAMMFVWMMRVTPPPEAAPAASLSGMLDGLSFAIKRPELIGTYVIDIVAMTFAFCTALFPVMAENWGGASAAGAMFSAMSVGSLLMTMFSGWTKKVRRHGAAVVLAAAAWGAATIAFGFSTNLYAALFFLCVAGATDMISGMFRGIIWNETIPNDRRGRLAGVEMISYMSGPLLGNARAGWMAAATTTQFSIISGGVVCVLGVALCGLFLPTFWRYRSAALTGEKRA